MPTKTKDTYRNAREAFDDLAVEEKARFMVEAMLSTVAEGIDRFTRAVSDTMENVTRDGRDAEEPSEEPKARADRKQASKSKPTRKRATGSNSKSSA